MPTWRAKHRRQDDAAVDRSPITVTGALRDAPGATPLKVKLTLLDGEVTLRTNEMELGTWSRSDVSITPTAGASYTFLAEGDELDFTPDKPSVFAESPFIAAAEVAPEEPKRRRGRGERAKGPVTPEPTDRGATNARHDAAVATDETPPRKAEAPAAPPVKRPRHAGRGRSEPQEARDGLWLRTLDRARERALFGLDRVQVDERLRGREHQHTFDHGTAAGYGPSKHICTICGKIKLR